MPGGKKSGTASIASADGTGSHDPGDEGVKRAGSGDGWRRRRPRADPVRRPAGEARYRIIARNPSEIAAWRAR